MVGIWESSFTQGNPEMSVSSKNNSPLTYTHAETSDNRTPSLTPNLSGGKVSLDTKHPYFDS